MEPESPAPQKKAQERLELSKARKFVTSSVIAIFALVCIIRVSLLVLGATLNPKIEEFNFFTSAFILIYVAYLCGVYALTLISKKVYKALLIIYFIFYGGYQFAFIACMKVMFDLLDFTPILFVFIHLFAATCFYFCGTRIQAHFATRSVVSYLRDLNTLLVIMIPVLANDAVTLIENYQVTTFSSWSQIGPSLCLGMLMIDLAVFKATCQDLIRDDLKRALWVFTRKQMFPYYICHVPMVIIVVVTYVAKLSVGSQHPVIPIALNVSIGVTAVGLFACCYIGFVFKNIKEKYSLYRSSRDMASRNSALGESSVGADGSLELQQGNKVNPES